ncbi:hypothetical protein F2Q70_00013486 [Brassica cretica]|uniref:Uncharacterized protein n=1 Tax=Brassica cretica TaxID=69181 RepID=A0A8S9LYE8_BRACR|nr:hypothetical protein F2Q70_00013486 [Brassica cretica]
MVIPQRANRSELNAFAEISHGGNNTEKGFDFLWLLANPCRDSVDLLHLVLIIPSDRIPATEPHTNPPKDSSKSQLSLRQRLRLSVLCGRALSDHVSGPIFTCGFQKLHRRIETEAAAWILYERRNETTSSLRIFGSLVGISKAKLSCWLKKASNFFPNQSCVLVKKQDDIVGFFFLFCP